MKEVNGYIQFYSRKGREKILVEARKLLVEAGIEGISDEFQAILDELIKNAIKSNYKFLIIRERLHRQILAKDPMKKGDEISRELGGITRSARRFNSAAGDILLTLNIEDKIREILREESKYLSIKNRADREERTFTSDENSVIMELTRLRSMKREINENDIRIILSIRYGTDSLILTVTNTSPLLKKDIKAIHRMRKEFRKYRDRGRTYDFFIKYSEDSDIGYGLGYAKIDSILLNWGLKPEESAKIQTSADTTVKVTLPVDVLKRRYRSFRR